MELGQTQRRLEIALTAAQKAAAVDELTGMMNFRSFTKGMADILDSMRPDDSGILIMIDGDHFKSINDNYGHSTGDEVIKLTAQMIVGRIRTVDLASRLHGDEFAIFVSNTNDYSVARRIMEDINQTLEKEAKRRNMPSITLSAGAVIARQGDTFANLSKTADAVLYEAKKTHNGGFAY
ncbi:GGDEF domain-containing protein [Clostridium sp. AM58-1XD]|uniref:GGDEF domain-containing protein n=1 Tax=Clostridium sp. AM58-1XD TaxID=2292307 RepID=UPI001FA8D2B0|nr:GGDEF domain-containing protein [Clostridium sp. AM58-1XD]